MLFAKSAFTEYFIRTSTILWGENHYRYYYLYFPNDQLSSEWILFLQGQINAQQVAVGSPHCNGCHIKRKIKISLPLTTWNVCGSY